jgi:DNA-directed RNA polymerase specialized sigma24 family protein
VPNVPQSCSELSLPPSPEAAAEVQTAPDSSLREKVGIPPDAALPDLIEIDLVPRNGASSGAKTGSDFSEVVTILDLKNITTQQLQHAEQIATGLRGVGNSLEDARDALQEVIGNVLHKARENPDFITTSVYSYVLKGVAMKLIDWGPSRRVIPVSLKGPQFDCRSLPPIEGMIQAEFSRHVQAAIELLPSEEQRNMLRRVYFNDETLPEIAEDLGKNVTALHMGMSRARQRLGRLIEMLQNDPSDFLQIVFKGMGPETKEAFTRRYVCAEDVETIAEALDVSVNAAYRYLRRGRNRFWSEVVVGTEDIELRKRSLSESTRTALTMDETAALELPPLPRGDFPVAPTEVRPGTTDVSEQASDRAE